MTGLADRLARGFKAERERGAKGNSKGFGLSNWKDRVPITKMGKIVGRVGWGRNQELGFDVCDTSTGRQRGGSRYASLEFWGQLWIWDPTLGIF